MNFTRLLDPQDFQAFQINETRSVFLNLSCGKTVDRSHCVCKSRFCGSLRSKREYFWLQLRHNLTYSIVMDIAPHQTDALQFLLQRSLSPQLTRQATTATNCTAHATLPQLRSPDKLSTTTQRESSNDHQNSAPSSRQSPRHMKNNVTVCHTPWIVFLSHAQNAPRCLMIRKDTTLYQDCGTESNCVCIFIVHRRVIVDNRCGFPHF